MLKMGPTLDRWSWKGAETQRMQEAAKWRHGEGVSDGRHGRPGC